MDIETAVFLTQGALIVTAAALVVVALTPIIGDLRAILRLRRNKS